MRWLALLGSAAMSFFAVRAIALQVADLFDPCMEWGIGKSGAFHARRLSPPGRSADPCASRHRGTSQTKRQAVALMMAVPGGILAASALGIAGQFRRRRRAAAAGGALMLLEAFPTAFSLAPIALLTGSAMLIAASRMKPP